MTIEKELKMVIDMIAHMNEEMTEKFNHIDERFNQIDQRFERVEENLETLRKENAEEHEFLHSKIAEVAEAVNNSNAMHEARFAALERKDAELARVQDLHSTEILKLQAG